MSKYDFYRKRLNPKDVEIHNIHSNSLVNSVRVKFFNSPTLNMVKRNDEEELVHAIVSDDDRFGKRRFLFEPETETTVGDYIHYDGYTYLIMDKTTDQAYPQMFGMVCNIDYPFITRERIKVGTNEIGNPIYKDKTTINYIKAIASSQAYSSLSNDPVPLPEGAMYIFMPYDKDREIEINEKYKDDYGEYKVTQVTTDMIVNGEGVLKVHLQKEVEKHDS